MARVILLSPSTPPTTLPGNSRDERSLGREFLAEEKRKREKEGREEKEEKREEKRVEVRKRIRVTSVFRSNIRFGKGDKK